MGVHSLFVLLAALRCITYVRAGSQQVLQDETPKHPRLNFSSPSPHIFHSTFGLLQQWPNIFFEFGHTIAPCTIPKDTNLYHAHFNATHPPSPEWFGFDAEMSYAIRGGLPNSHLLTYRTVKDVKCLYFDGTSASLMHEGSMDSQMVFIYNNSANVPERPHFGPPRDGFNSTPSNRTNFNPIVAEYDRASRLCDFFRENGLGGLGWGYESVVRMNAGFELIWCNFSSPSARLVSWLNVSAPALDDLPGLDDPWTMMEDKHSEFPSRSRGSGRPWPIVANPFLIHGDSIYDWFQAAAQRYGFVGGVPGRGETRVKLDSCTLFTLYNPALQDQGHARVVLDRKRLNLTVEGYWQRSGESSETTAALSKLVKRRRIHRAVNVSQSDGVYMRNEIENQMRATLKLEQITPCSGIDWIAIARDVVSLYSTGIYELSKQLSKFTDLPQNEIREWLASVRALTHRIYMPYYEYPLITSDTLDRNLRVRSPTSQAALVRCTSQYEPPDFDELSSSEMLTYSAIQDVLSAICRTALPIFLSTERFWLSHFNNASDLAPLPAHSVLRDLKSTTKRYHEAVEELMAWLGWIDQWTACSPGCKLGEVCYVPMWPVMARQRHRSGNATGDLGSIMEMDLWEPRCVDAERYRRP